MCVCYSTLQSVLGSCRGVLVLGDVGRSRVVPGPAGVVDGMQSYWEYSTQWVWRMFIGQQVLGGGRSRSMHHFSCSAVEVSSWGVVASG
jgi:hypothetical protein